MIELIQVGAAFVDKAWADGAHRLAESCEASGGEITGDQLKLILARGERSLIGMKRDGEFAGWGVVSVDQLPNCRVLFVTNLWAPGAGHGEFFIELRKVAQAHGCSRIRCAAQPAQARLYAQTCDLKPLYSILEVQL